MHIRDAHVHMHTTNGLKLFTTIKVKYTHIKMLPVITDMHIGGQNHYAFFIDQYSFNDWWTKECRDIWYPGGKGGKSPP